VPARAAITAKCIEASPLEPDEASEDENLLPYLPYGLLMLSGAYGLPCGPYGVNVESESHGLALIFRA
jgi:hypothetical protein